MAALKEDRSYGLSCGRVSDGSKVSVFHVKLTDSALRAFESYRASQGVWADPDSVSPAPQVILNRWTPLGRGSLLGGGVAGESLTAPVSRGVWSLSCLL
ncbi:hypothetical protein FD754_008383 [Muntiacus muntjak]|uniref:RNA polymerase II elongation factor ELL N-terminal domain-containing protein n=1 Tax=Muntiacus muntjak TaxID=9888 RepID=A0A5N3WTJ7_MUNMU|nr:hypothetical protein FD754_008383 [Muntiacus muntjak]